MENNLKGTQKAQWVTYKWECQSQNIMTTKFDNANNAVATVTDTAKNIVMIHPTEMDGQSKALKIESKQGTFTALLKDKTAKVTNTFFVYSIADGGKELVSGPYSVKLDCDKTVTVKEVTTTVPDKTFIISDPNYHRVTINEYDVMYLSEPNRSIKAHCPILTYNPTATSSVVSLKSGCAQPCRIFDFVHTKPASLSTTVAVTVTGGKTFTSTTPITANIICGLQSTVITLPTISDPYWVSIDGTTVPQIEIDDATSSFCEINQWKLTSDGAANTVLTNV